MNKIEKLELRVLDITRQIQELDARRTVLKTARRRTWEQIEDLRNGSAQVSTKDTQYVSVEVVRRALEEWFTVHGGFKTLAHKSGIKFETIKKIRYGKGRKTVTLHVADKLLSAMHVHLDDSDILDHRQVHAPKSEPPFTHFVEE